MSLNLPNLVDDNVRSSEESTDFRAFAHVNVLTIADVDDVYYDDHCTLRQHSDHLDHKFLFMGKPILK